MKSADSSLTLLGWREWLSLPSLNIEPIKAKVDTGARTTALHASSIEIYQSAEGEERVRFNVHPRHGDPSFSVACDQPLTSCRSVRDSGGKEESRPFITLPLAIGEQHLETEVSLTDRTNMKFRMLLGRTALKGRFAVDSASSYLVSSRPKRR